MITTAQVFTILGILSAPMVGIAALVLTLAALNLSLGIRKLLVRILAFTFDYATKIKRDREVSIDPDISSDEPSTPTKTAQVDPPFVEESANDPIEINSKTPLTGQSELDDDTDSSNAITTTNQDQKISSTPSQNDIQFKLGK